MAWGMRADPGKAQGKDTTKDETLTKLIEDSKMQASTATEIFEELATVDGPVARGKLVISLRLLSKSWSRSTSPEFFKKIIY